MKYPIEIAQDDNGDIIFLFEGKKIGNLQEALDKE